MRKFIINFLKEDEYDLKEGVIYLVENTVKIILTVILIIFAVSTIFPQYTIMDNGDLTFKVRGLLINHVEVQEIETNVETIESQIVWAVMPTRFSDSEITVSHEAEIEGLKLFHSEEEEYKIKFGKVVAYPRIEAIALVLLGHNIITKKLIPYLISKFA